MQGRAGVQQLVDEHPDLRRRGTGLSPSGCQWPDQLFEETGLPLGGDQVTPEVPDAQPMSEEAGRHPGHQNRVVVVHRLTLTDPGERRATRSRKAGTVVVAPAPPSPAEPSAAPSATISAMTFSGRNRSRCCRSTQVRRATSSSE